MLLQDALHAANGVALAIEQAADALEQVDIVGAVVTPAAGALHRLALGETCPPEPQHMLGNVGVARGLADGSERIRRLLQIPAPLSLNRLDGFVSRPCRRRWGCGR